MKKTLFAFALLSGLLYQAQIGAGVPRMQIGNSKWTIGGNAGLGGAIGSNGGGTTLYLSPRVGYKLAENFELGAAGNLSWTNSKYYSNTSVGIGPFANYYFARSFFASGLFQQYFINMTNKTNNANAKVSESALYLGGGYMQRLGEHVYMQIGGMYNVLYNSQTSVFGGGFIPQVGIVYGL